MRTNLCQQAPMHRSIQKFLGLQVDDGRFIIDTLDDAWRSYEAMIFISLVVNSKLYQLYSTPHHHRRHRLLRCHLLRLHLRSHHSSAS